jgi:predicted Zn-dependent peptidase
MSFHQAKLKNGIKVIFSPQLSTQAVSVLVLVKVGSRFETKENNGIAHFVEHLMFKGTERRPSTLIISQELDSIGADYNAFTSKEKTGYYIKAESSNLPLLIDLLADMTTNSIFDPQEVERERGTILEEINMYEDNPMAKIGDFFEEDLYGTSSPLGRHVIGTPHNIRAIRQSRLKVFWKKHYHAQNIAIAIAGNFNQANARKLLEESFGSIVRGKRNNLARKAGAASGAVFAAHHKKTSQAHMMLGFPGVHNEHKDRYALGLLSTILGGNMSSRLFIQVRERLGLCYFIRSSADTMEDVGSLVIHAGLDKKKFGKALEAISMELRDIKHNGVSKEELIKAKQYIKGKMALSYEDSLEVASFYGIQSMFYKKVVNPQEIFKRISAVRTNDIMRVAHQIMDKKKVHISTLSPYKDIHKFASLLDF